MIELRNALEDIELMFVLDVTPKTVREARILDLVTLALNLVDDEEDENACDALNLSDALELILEARKARKYLIEEVREDNDNS